MTTSQRPDLKLVAQPPEPSPYDEKRGKKRVETLRSQLLRAAVRYVRDGREMSPQERLRQASDLSGIPRGVIEYELRKTQ